MGKKTWLVFVFLIYYQLVSGQEKITTAGFQFKPIFPSNFFSTGPQHFESEGVQFVQQQKSGFCAGMVIRKGISKNWSFETGINFVNRHYEIEAKDSGNVAKTKFRIISYEIPLLALLFVQLSQQIYMDVGFGPSFDFFPSDVYSETENLNQYGGRRSWVATSLMANLGFEYRTEKSGYIYLGASLHRPFQFIYYSQVVYSGRVKPVEALEKLGGNYLTFDIRYFFHADPEKRKKKKN